MKKKIEKSLKTALLLEGKMSQALYEYELVEHLDYWKEGLKRDKEDFCFVVTYNNGDVAMLLMTNEELYINEEARKILQLFWKDQYKPNIEAVLPKIVSDLMEDCFGLVGVITTTIDSRKKFGNQLLS